MAKTPKSLLSIPALLLHVIGIPTFYLGFILIYESQWMARFLDGGNANDIFNVLMLTCILMGVLCASRITMSSLRKHISLSWWQYVLWSLLEITVFSAFAALFIAFAIFQSENSFSFTE